jgi:nitroimidazol reductase NimA-like FMN-containing flavoprotein (pyridoxamine 5'-phosphate oxidase superfamily)
MAPELKQTDKTTISRHAERGSYDRSAAYAILDEGLVAHVGVDLGQGVMVIPMTYARLDDELILHGAVASRWLSGFDNGRPISVCVTLLDGLVLARAAFSHSMNYRSVVLYGQAHVLRDPEKKGLAFKALLDHLLPGRWEDCKHPDQKEIDATTVLTMTIDEASVKIRSGAPKDAAKDLGLDYWTGVIPLSLEAGEPVAAPDAPQTAPSYTHDYSRG